jgi:hypothetical protein
MYEQNNETDYCHEKKKTNKNEMNYYPEKMNGMNHCHRRVYK